MMVASLVLLLLSADGDPEPKQLTLFVARPARSADNTVSFDLRAEVPSSVASVPPIDSCVITLALPGGEKPKLKEKRSALIGRAWTTHVEYAATEAAGPAVWELSMKCTGLDSGPTPQRFGVFGTPPNAWMVMVTGSKVEAEAKEKAAQFARNGMTWNSFPRVLESQWVLGLTPGFFVVALAVTDDEKLAKTLTKELQADTGGLGANTYMKPVWWSGPLDVRLLIIEKIEDSGGVIPTEYNEVFMLQHGAPSDTSVRGRSGTFLDDGALLLFTRSAAGGPDFELAVSAPQTQCDQKPKPKTFQFTEARIQRVAKLKLACFQGD